MVKRKMTLREKVKTAFFGALTFGGIAATVAGIADFEFVPVFIAGIPFMTGGSFGVWHTRKRYKERIKHSVEQQLLEVMSVHGEYVTIAQVARMTGMPVDLIEEHMNNLQAKGVVEIGTTNNGAVVYQLPAAMQRLYDQRSYY